MKWSQLKTLYEHNMTFVSDALSYQCDLFHALGCYYALEKGLLRTSNGLGKNYRDLFVFPELHGVGNGYASMAMSKEMKLSTERLFPEAGKHLLSLISSRSLRKASTTELRIHQDVGLNGVLMRGGWSSGTTVDSYSCSPTAATLPAGKALSGWMNAKAQVYPPQLHSLGMQYRTEFDTFVESVFGTPSLALFRKGETLHHLLEVCAATLVMYHNDFVADFTIEHPLAQKMLKAARIAFGEQHGASKLQEFSNELKDQFRIANSIAASNDSSRQNNENTALLQQLVNHILDQNTRIKNLEQTSQNLSVAANMEIRNLKRTVEQMASKRTEQPRSKQITLCSADDTDDDDDNDEVLIIEGLKPAGSSNIAVASKRQANLIPQSAPPHSAPKNAFQLLMPSNASQTAKRASAGGGKASQEEALLSTILTRHYRGKKIRAGCAWNSIHFECDSKNKSKYEKSMEFMQAQATPAEKKRLSCYDPPLTGTELHAVTKAIETRSMIALNQKEGKKAETTSRQRPTYPAVGNRLLGLDKTKVGNKDDASE
jgi:hypothetical protein